MKYLLNLLQNYDNENILYYKQLFNEIKDLNRISGGFNADKNDKLKEDEWSETLERVITEVRNSPGSVAFHKPVRKFEAPDYHLVIKNPMDLSTISKKIKAKLYQNKKSFANDLNQIWTNCLIYNTDPSHPLRANATHLRKKSEQLLEFVPDSPNDDDDFSSNNNIDSQVLGKRGMKSHSIPKKRKIDTPTPHYRDSKSMSASPQPFKQPSQKSTTMSNNNNVEVDEKNLSPQLTKQELKDILSNAPFPDSLALVRPSENLVQLQIQDDEIEDEQDQNFDSWKLINDDLTKTWWMDEQQGENTLCKGIPSVSKCKINNDNIKRRKVMNNNLMKINLNKNIKLLKKLRRSKRYLNFIANDSNCNNINDDDYDIDHETDSDENDHDYEDYNNDTDNDNEQSLDEISTENQHIGIYLKRTIMKLLSHSGFESGTESAINMLMNITSTYLENLGTNLKYYCDNYTNEIKPDEMILHVLNENGNMTVDEIEDYVYGVETYGRNLRKINTQIKSTIGNLTSNSNFSKERDINIDEKDLTNEDKLRDVFQLLGEDYFGLNEIGIDDESICGIKVPNKLLKGEEDSKTNNKNINDEKLLDKYSPVHKLTSLSSLDNVIGLLKPYFNNRKENLQDDLIEFNQGSQHAKGLKFSNSGQVLNGVKKNSLN